MNKGYWTGFNGNKCSQCGMLCEETKDGITPNFCPNCGADMREEVSAHDGTILLQYKGILFDDYTRDEDGNYWAEMCEKCAEKYGDLVKDEKDDGGTACACCSVAGCNNMGVGKLHFYIDFKKEFIGFVEKEKKMAIHERLSEAGYENILLLDNYSYDDAFVGVSNDDRAIYDYDKMVEWLVETQGFSVEDAVEWIDYNTIRALPYYGNEAPIILNRLDSENEESTDILKEFADRLKEELSKIIIPRSVNDPEEANLDSDQVWEAIDSLVMQMTGQKA